MERVGGEGDAGAGVERGGDLVEGAGDDRRDVGQGADVRRVRLVEQGDGVGFGQRVPALVGRAAGVVDGHDAGDRLVLEPLAGVALVDVDPRRNLGDAQP
ncbi:MAG TPA: hypothetical protein VE623_02160 [Acidimicrobiales bacterium]|nr:hypothetical protein [Acidimicrobiales bacterium]